MKAVTTRNSEWVKTSLGPYHYFSLEKLECGENGYEVLLTASHDYMTLIDCEQRDETRAPVASMASQE